jgi:hypothetical protein
MKLIAAFEGKATVCSKTGALVATEGSRLVLLWRCRCGQWAKIGANFCGYCARKLGRDNGRES